MQTPAPVVKSDNTIKNCLPVLSGPDVKILVIDVAGRCRHRPGERFPLTPPLSVAVRCSAAGWDSRQAQAGSDG